MTSPSTPVPASVTAVVVTYNRLALLQRCIEALRSQTRPLDGIIVVNNSSTDGTGEWLHSQPDLQTVTQENRGGSFGFYTGIKTAFERGFEWIWCMDDDGHTAPDALALLLEYSARKPCVINALVLDEADADRIVFKTGPYTRRSEVKELIIEGAANPFNGTLIHRGVVERTGLPQHNLTIWGDETEYYNRIRYQQGFPVFTVTAAAHFHPAQYSVFYKKEWNAASDWKTFFFIRNKAFVYAARYRSQLRAWLSYVLFVIAFTATIFVYQKRDRVAKLRLVWAAARDGFRKDTSRGIAEARVLLARLSAKER